MVHNTCFTVEGDLKEDRRKFLIYLLYFTKYISYLKFNIFWDCDRVVAIRHAISSRFTRAEFIKYTSFIMIHLKLKSITNILIYRALRDRHDPYRYDRDGSLSHQNSVESTDSKLCYLTSSEVSCNFWFTNIFLK